MELTLSHWIGIAGVLATVLVGVVSWVVSSTLTRRSIDRKALGYRMKVTPLMTTSLQSEGLKIEFGGEPLQEPTLLTVEVMNLGNVAIEHPPISIAASDKKTYLIPVQIEDMPSGYEDLWGIERADNGVCAIKLDHINPKQTVKVTMLMSEIPHQLPHFRCPAANLSVQEVKETEVKTIALDLANGFLTPVPFSSREVAASIVKILDSRNSKHF